MAGWDSPRDWGNENEAPGGRRESGGSGGSRGFDENACRNCGATDHFARNCPNNDTGYNDSSARTCHNCNQPGHDRVDCPEPRKSSGACFNCNQEGHNKADCPEPRQFKGICRLCEKEGHPAALCPERPPDICRNCRVEGHLAKDCKANRKFDLNHIADLMPDEAWANMKTASDEKEIQEFREALQVYSKAVPLSTYADIEKKMREEDFKIHLIALEKEPLDVMSIIDLQGQLDREYVVGYFLAAKPLRKHLLSRWPSSPEDNLERLANAGLPFDREIIKCRNCGELGHPMKGCKQEPREFDRVEIKCNNCGEIGHRVRDCKEPRKSKDGCRNCGSADHIAKECSEPRSAADVECRRCNQTGHFAKDCPNVEARAPRTCRNCGSEDHIAHDCDQPRDPSTMTCHNCDEVGHGSRECPKPKDWTRVKCRQCGEMGHSDKRCPENRFERPPRYEPTPEESYQEHQSKAWDAATGDFEQNETSEDDRPHYRGATVADEGEEEAGGYQW